MPDRELVSELQVMKKAALAGARVLVEHFANLESLPVRSKGPADLVSEADLQSEAAIRAVLMSAYPDAAYVGEESEATAGRSEREWVVDPLDGTTNFLCGLPHFAISIALRESGETVCGLIIQPLTGEVFAAMRGMGATRNGQPINVSTRSRWQEVVVGTGIPHHGSEHHARFAMQLEQIRDRVGGLRRLGSAALDLAYVACGRLDGFWEQGLHAWDVAAGNLLVREAGGVVTGLEPEHDADGGASILAATPWLHEGMLAAFARSKPHSM